jgi:fibronectin type 3 domain-containing protein
MNRLFIALTLLGCVSFSFAQVLQGKATLSGNANIVSGHSVTLTWNASASATSYNLYRGTASGGPYVQVASGILVPTYTDTQVGHSQTLYYVATAVQGTSESGYSNQAVAVIP